MVEYGRGSQLPLHSTVGRTDREDRRGEMSGYRGGTGGQVWGQGNRCGDRWGGKVVTPTGGWDRGTGG